jgi:NitT/TauT family transport system substrate-binding protein
MPRHVRTHDLQRIAQDHLAMMKSTPQKIIAQGTDWRYLNELKKELKV